MIDILLLLAGPRHHHPQLLSQRRPVPFLNTSIRSIRHPSRSVKAVVS
jgi:hypothetical protein